MTYRLFVGWLGGELFDAGYAESVPLASEWVTAAKEPLDDGPPMDFVLCVSDDGTVRDLDMGGAGWTVRPGVMCVQTEIDDGRTKFEIVDVDPREASG